MANLLKEIWDSDAACADRPWRASQLVLTWWRTALREEALVGDAAAQGRRKVEKKPGEPKSHAGKKL
jgi:hypothetical protein